MFTRHDEWREMTEKVSVIESASSFSSLLTIDGHLGFSTRKYVSKMKLEIKKDREKDQIFASYFFSFFFHFLLFFLETKNSFDIERYETMNHNSGFMVQ